MCNMTLPGQPRPFLKPSKMSVGQGKKRFLQENLLKVHSVKNVQEVEQVKAMVVIFILPGPRIRGLTNMWMLSTYSLNWE